MSVFVSLYLPVYIRGGLGVYIGITLSVCPSVHVFDRVRSISPAQPFLFYLTKLGVVMHDHGAMCHAETLVHYLQCQGHSEGLNKQNRTISTVSTEVLFQLQPNLVCIISQSVL